MICIIPLTEGAGTNRLDARAQLLVRELNILVQMLQQHLDLMVVVVIIVVHWELTLELVLNAHQGLESIARG